jgi:hypothetical protein
MKTTVSGLAANAWLSPPTAWLAAELHAAEPRTDRTACSRPSRGADGLVGAENFVVGEEEDRDSARRGEGLIVALQLVGEVVDLVLLPAGAVADERDVLPASILTFANLISPAKP